MSAVSSLGSHLPGVRKVTVLRANAIGDFVVALPALAALRRAYPAAELTIIGDVWHADLLSDRPGPWDRIVVAPRYPGLRGQPFDAVPGPEYEAFVAVQAAESYDLVVQLHGGGRTSNEVVRALEPRVSIGARTPDAPQLDRWTPYVVGRHETLRCLEIVALAGATIDSVRDLEPHLEVTDTDCRESRRIVPGEIDIVVHPGANDPRRRWPVTAFAALLERLTGLGRQVTLLGGPADRPVADQLWALTYCEYLDIVGRAPLRTTLGLLARARLFVGNDSGPRHLAAAVGVPTVGIFWAPNLQTFGPLVGDHRAVTAYATGCPRCGADWIRCGHELSMVASVPVDEVVEAAMSLSPSVAEQPSRHKRMAE